MFMNSLFVLTNRLKSIVTIIRILHLKIFCLVLLFNFFSCRSSKMGQVKRGEDGKVVSGITRLKCTYPAKKYSKDLDIKVKSNVDSLLNVSFSQLNIGIAQTITRLSNFTSDGLDLDLFLFRICEMANNRGLNNSDTKDLIISAIDKWNTNAEIKREVDSLVMKEDKRQQRESEGEMEKQTPPEFDINLYINNRCFYFIVLFKNKVPINYRFTFNGLQPVESFFITSHPFSPLSPVKYSAYIITINCYDKYKRPGSGKAQVVLKLEYQSQYFALIGDPKLTGQIIKPYILDWDTQSLTETK